MFLFQEGITHVAAIWKGRGSDLAVFLVLYTTDPARLDWRIFQRTEHRGQQPKESTIGNKVEKPEHALQGTRLMLAQLGGLRGLARLRCVEVHSDSYLVYTSKLKELEGLDLSPVPVSGGNA